MSAQIQWLIDHELDQARRKHGISFEHANVRSTRNQYSCAVHYAGVTGLGESISAAADSLAVQLVEAKLIAQGKRMEARRLMDEANQLEVTR